MNYIYVLDLHGNPLMPTVRYCHVRKLLKDKKAKIVDYKPFTIQLLYEIDNVEVDTLILGIDSGRTNIGFKVIDQTGHILFAAEVETRNKDVPKLMKERKQHRQASRAGRRKRRQRRAVKNKTVFKNGETKERKLPQCKEPITVHHIKNKEAKFCNRKRPAGWLTPTAIQLLRTHLNMVKKICNLLPIQHCVLETNKFAFMVMDNPNILNWQYQKGPLYGLDDVNAYIYKEQKGKCLFCNNDIEEYHHIVEQSQGGSDTIKNIAGLCKHHHQLVHTDEDWFKKLKDKKTGCMKEYAALSVLNQIIPYLAKGLGSIFGNNFHVCDGHTTHDIRKKYNLPKDHHVDAYCIALSILDENNIQIDNNTDCFYIKQYRRHNRQQIHCQKERTYKLNGQAVAKNKRKRTGQTEPSLHEWYIEQKHLHGIQKAKAKQSQLKVLKSTRSYRKQTILMPGTIFLYNGNRYVLTGISNGGLYYRAYGQGVTNFKAKECVIAKHNIGLVFM